LIANWNGYEVGRLRTAGFDGVIVKILEAVSPHARLKLGGVSVKLGGGVLVIVKVQGEVYLLPQGDSNTTYKVPPVASKSAKFMKKLTVGEYDKV
jgi:hypothetical protein